MGTGKPNDSDSFPDGSDQPVLNDAAVNAPLSVLASPRTTPRLKRGQHHHASHYAVLALNSLIALACFLGAGALVFGQSVLNDQQQTPAIKTLTPLGQPTAGPVDSTATNSDSSVVTQPGETGVDQVTTTTESFPMADPNANNFLITGSDNQACADPDSANPVEPRDELGERTDTIMIMRVDPSTGRAAVLSFPRDLWVKIAGTDGSNRINSAYREGDPQRLIDTIQLPENFYIPVDHYIQINFCAFKTLVDAVGGVSVPFKYAARDENTNLDIPAAGCYQFDGDSALAYVRSRYYEYLDPETGEYKQDPTSDYGRIARQQDFLRRAVAKVLSRGVFDLDVARGLIEVAQNYVVHDRDLTIDKQLEFAGVLKNLDPSDIRTYRVEGLDVKIGGKDVIRPALDGENMQAILSIFRGTAQLETAPEQVFETTTTVDFSTTTSSPSTTTSPSTVNSVRPGSTTTTTPATTTTETALPQVEVDQNLPQNAIVPDENTKC